MNEGLPKKINKDLKAYIFLRITLAVVISLVILYGGAQLFHYFTGDTTTLSPYHQALKEDPTVQKIDALLRNALKSINTAHASDSLVTQEVPAPQTEPLSSAEPSSPPSLEPPSPAPITISQETPGTIDRESTLHIDIQNEMIPDEQVASDHMAQDMTPLFPDAVRGTAFVSALIEPIEYEIKYRFLGWRPNDIVSLFTDNIKNHQLGTLEVTRRTSEKLTERIARTGSTVKFDKSLNLARTKFNNDPKKYWLPAPEKSYAQAIHELRSYRNRLNTNQATFHSRADNLIPLLESYENLLGDCDDDLVKAHEDSGARVNTFKADDYFYYAQGVSSAMFTMLEAIMVDFAPVLDSRGAANDLQHAMLMLQRATNLNPLFIQESSYSGFFANHRANMATFISHARAYIQFVIKTMST